MAPLPACDINTWIPPVPAGVAAEAGFVANAAGVNGWVPGYNYGWNCQTYLGTGTAGIVQTYSVKAPVAEEVPDKPQASPAKPKTKAGK